MKSYSDLEPFLLGSGRVEKTIDVSVMRDMLGAIVPPHISFSSSTPYTPTTISPAGNWQKIQGGTQLNNTPNFMTMPESNRATYIGDSMRHFHIAVTVTFYVGGTGQAGDIISLALAKNGVEDLATQIQYRIPGPGSTNIVSTAIHGDYHMIKGDYLELFGTVNRTNANIDIVNTYFFAVGMFQ